MWLWNTLLLGGANRGHGQFQGQSHKVVNIDVIRKLGWKNVHTALPCIRINKNDKEKI